ncbi:hypothetical protein QMK17_15235 [Rhodococcus sp. G-MC3]|uniref:hypothetical protein n=1 Tax=Rhodococcus sp. G-MC3 TaxID=3046209 RepID=UPI0024BAA8D5|nr:hypothetical protein [Rhodococcus sp. G-MC3]MDJ0394677.1 hypothetical protein [Rhodococcus sp. G-MC3]
MGTQHEPSCPRSDLRRDILRALGMPSHLHESSPGVTYGRAWTRDGIDGVELTWNCQSGHRAPTEAWLLTPAGTTVTELHAVLLLHGHDGMKFYGKEKVADGPDGITPGVVELRKRGYDGQAVAASLVGEGFAVLVHDVFPWGSRRVRWDDLPARARQADNYEAAAREHEHGLAKVAALTGTSLAGQVLQEDLVALEVLRTLTRRKIAAAGFSGGGARVAHLVASADLDAAVITAMMSTFDDIAAGHADDTTWLMITPGLPAVCDWPDVAASASPMPLLVQFALADTHFGLQGMRDAESMLQRAYDGAATLTTEWHESCHRFTAEMQRSTAQWLRSTV